MKGFIEIVVKGSNPILVNLRYIVEVAEVDENHCAIHMASNNFYQLPIPYNRVVELIKEAME